MSDTSVSDEHRIAGVVERLARQSEGAVPVKVIEGQVRAEFAQWEGVLVQDFVPIFVERRVTDNLGLRRSVGSLGAARARIRRHRSPMRSRAQ